MKKTVLNSFTSSSNDGSGGGGLWWQQVAGDVVRWSDCSGSVMMVCGSLW